MRATVQSAALAEALKHSAAPAKTTLDILQFARIRAADGRLVIDTTDTELSVTVNVPAEVDDEGEMLFHEATLRSIAAGGGSLLFKDDGHVSRGRSRYKVGVRSDIDGFPGQEHLQWETIEASCTELAAAVACVDYAADDKDVRSFCRVITIEPGRVWASDGKVAARRRVDYEGPRFHVPVRQVPRMLAALGQPEARLSVGRAPRVRHVVAVRVESEHLTLTLRTFEVPSVPEIERFVPDPADAAARITLDRRSMIDALRRFVPFSAWSGEKGINHVVALELQPEAVVMTDRNGESVEHLTEAGAAVEHSGQVRVGMHPKQLMAALSAIDTDQAVIHIAPEKKGAALLQPVDGASDRVAHVLMPFTL